MAIPILSVLGLLGKLPKAIPVLGKILGVKSDKGVVGKITKVLDGIDQLTPQQSEEIQRLAEEHKHDIERLQIEVARDNYKQSQETWREEVQSEDPYVRQTRPRILRQLFYLVGIQSIVYPLVVYLMLRASVGEAIVTNLISLCTQIYFYTISLFGVGFTGYTVARTVDKKSKNGESPLSFLGGMLKK